MWRLKIWGIAYGPIIVGNFVMFKFNETVGLLIMAISFITIKIALDEEHKILVSKGINIENGSALGNILAKVFGVIIVGGAAWLFFTMVKNIYTGNF